MAWATEQTAQNTGMIMTAGAELRRARRADGRLPGHCVRRARKTEDWTSWRSAKRWSRSICTARFARPRPGDPHQRRDEAFNFLLWQLAYTEIYVTPTLWPDFDGNHLLEALADFQRRERRYGAVGEAF